VSFILLFYPKPPLFPWIFSHSIPRRTFRFALGLLPHGGRFLVFWRGAELVQFMQLDLQQFLVRQEGFILGDHGRGEGAAEAILDDLFILGGAEQQTDGRVFVRLAVVAVEGFEVEIELAAVIGRITSRYLPRT
jgi:hypothetical protein